ncbi:MAG: glycosyltransferase family 4 protein [Magnetococcus sp. WYHC-3]
MKISKSPRADAMITIDARWLYVSGIGTYLRNVIPGILSGFQELRFTLLGNLSEMARLPGADGDHVTLVEARSPMYSIAEQFEIPRLIPNETTLFFSPHFNIPLLYRGPLVVTVYDMFHLAMPQFVKGLHKRLYAQMMFMMVRRRAEAILTISHFSKSELIRFTGAEERAIIPVHLGVSPDWFDPLAGAQRPHQRKYLLFVGNVKPHKNLRSLILAFGKIKDRIDFDLVIVGKKEGFITGDDNVAAEARSLGERVLFTGYVEYTTLRQFFAHADGLVFPSLYEGFGLPPLEAMAVGCPTLVSNTGPMPEICGDASLYCDPLSVDDMADKMVTLVTDQDLRATLRERGLRRARQFDWAVCIEQTRSVFAELLNRLGERELKRF